MGMHVQIAVVLAGFHHCAKAQLRVIDRTDQFLEVVCIGRRVAANDR